jgi:transposase-like protein
LQGRDFRVQEVVCDNQPMSTYNLEGHKERLGLWISENEGAKFWLSVLAKLQSRRVIDILIAFVDGLKGFPDAINAVYPEPVFSSALSTG